VSEILTKEAFKENLNTRFRVSLGDANTTELELIEVLGTISTPRQEQFSIFFRGTPDYLLPQSTYQMEHEKLGEIDIFLVPVGREQDGFRYEAVFNYVNQGK
jgi:L-ascorbate metabolism protein UlaG (beta-lactamase superfamily)